MSTYHKIKELDPVVTYEILLNVERVAQPEGDAQFNPTRNGDCFVCSSAAIINYFCKEKNITPPSMSDIYHKGWAPKGVGGATGGSYYANKNFWNQFSHNLDWWDIKFELIEDPAIDLEIHYPPTFGPRIYNEQIFIKRVRTYLEAGYLIHVQMQSEPQTERNKQGLPQIGSDHLVVIDGFRTTESFTLSCYDKETHWSGSFHNFIHVVDSSRKKTEPYWMSVSDWIKNHGGYSMLFIRPKRDKCIPFPPKETCPEHLDSK